MKNMIFCRHFVKTDTDNHIMANDMMKERKMIFALYAILYQMSNNNNGEETLIKFDHLRNMYIREQTTDEIIIIIIINDH